MTRFWITKYALTKGIFDIETNEPSVEIPSLITDPKYSLTCYHGEGKDWHRTEDAARAKAEKMRKKKIASLREQIEKLENQTF